MFKINKIYIKGFHSKNRIVEFDFTKEHTTIIFGENGCGKTTLLEILEAVFSRNEKILLNNKVEEIRITIGEIEGEKEIGLWCLLTLGKYKDSKLLIKKVVE